MSRTAAEASAAAATAYVGLVTRLREVLESHPSGADIQLLISPDLLEVSADEVLVQEVDTQRREARLVPRRIADLCDDDVVHDSQVVGLHADDVNAAAPKCLVRFPDGPNKPCHFHN